jgi:small subunit ribosomal protein S1
MEDMNKEQPEIQVDSETKEKLETPIEVNEAPALAEEVKEEVVETKEVVVEAKEEVVATDVVEETAETVQVPTESMDDYAKEIDASMKRVVTGDIVDCVIISVNEDEIIVNLDYVADGLIGREDLHLKPAQPIAEAYQVGDELKAEVLSTNDGEGNVRLSLKKADQIIVWDRLEAHFTDKTSFMTTITEVVKGGVLSDIKGVRAFMPASMISVAYVADLSEFVGQELEVHVVDFDRADRKVIISHKVIDQKEREVAKENFFENLKKDQEFSGTVKKLMNFGAFIDLGGVDGLLHINEMSWKRIKHPSEVMKEGDVVEVYINEVDTKSRKISLGLKNIDNNPWDNIFDHYGIGKVYEAEVVRLMNFGAFVKLNDGIEGLVHISEISEDRINQPQDVLTVGDKVKVKVLNIDSDKQKIALSIKEAKNEQAAVDLKAYSDDQEATTSLESVFAKFKDKFK